MKFPAILLAMCALVHAAPRPPPAFPPPPVCSLEDSDGNTMSEMDCPGNSVCDVGPVSVDYDDETLSAYYCRRQGGAAPDLDEIEKKMFFNACELSIDGETVNGPQTCGDSETCSGGALSAYISEIDADVDAYFCMEDGETFDPLDALKFKPRARRGDAHKNIAITHKKKWNKNKKGDDAPPTPPPLKRLLEELLELEAENLEEKEENPPPTPPPLKRLLEELLELEAENLEDKRDNPPPTPPPLKRLLEELLELEENLEEKRDNPPPTPPPLKRLLEELLELEENLEEKRDNPPPTPPPLKRLLEELLELEAARA